LNSSVIPGTTPVLSFGDARRARVATLGLNPSRVEFLYQNGNELTGDSRRLRAAVRLDVPKDEWVAIKILANVLEDWVVLRDQHYSA
jgi:hypothetical protein